MTEQWKWDVGVLVDQDGKKKAVCNGSLISCDSTETRNLIARAPEQAQKLNEIDLLLSGALTFSDSNLALVHIHKTKLNELIESIRKVQVGTVYAHK